MDKYLLLIVLNLPFVIFGYTKTIIAYRTHSIRRAGLVVRLAFWTIILIGLLFARDIYNVLNAYNLTDSTPLSIADVVLVTGLLFCLFLITRLYARIDTLEKRVGQLHEQTSIFISKHKKRP